MNEGIRRCNISDGDLKQRAEELEQQIGGIAQLRQATVTGAKLPDPDSTSGVNSSTRTLITTPPQTAARRRRGLYDWVQIAPPLVFDVS